MDEDKTETKKRETPCKEFSMRWGMKTWAYPDIEANMPKLMAWLLINALRFIFQGERGEGGYYHFQIYANWKSKKRAKALAVESNEQFPGINVQPASNEGRNALKHYCMKDDSRVAGPWADHAIYRGEGIPKYEKLSRFQQQLVDHINTEADERVIEWFVDKIGNTGKTTLAKYLMYHKLAHCFGYGRDADFGTVVKKQGTRRAYVWDLTRSKSSDFTGGRDDLYVSLESFKNGVIWAPKHDSEMIMQAQPHVIIFANWHPDKSKLSADRWNVTEMTPEMAYNGPRKEPNVFKFKPDPFYMPGDYYAPDRMALMQAIQDADAEKQQKPLSLALTLEHPKKAAPEEPWYMAPDAF